MGCLLHDISASCFRLYLVVSVVACGCEFRLLITINSVVTCMLVYIETWFGKLFCLIELFLLIVVCWLICICCGFAVVCFMFGRVGLVCFTDVLIVC